MQPVLCEAVAATCSLATRGVARRTVARLCDDGMLNDDLVVLLPVAGGWTVHATPFWNPTQVEPVGPRAAPLAALFRLVQDSSVYCRPMAGGQALAEFVSSVPVIAGGPELVHLLFERGQNLLQDVPMYALHFLPDASFWNAVEAVA